MYNYKLILIIIKILSNEKLRKQLPVLKVVVFCNCIKIKEFYSGLIYFSLLIIFDFTFSLCSGVSISKSSSAEMSKITHNLRISARLGG